MSDIEPVHLESHRHWEHEASFNEILAEQLHKAPYLIASVFLHAVIGFVVGGIMLLTQEDASTPVIEMQAVDPPPEVEEEEEEPPEEVIEEVLIKSFSEVELGEEEAEEILASIKDMREGDFIPL